MANQQGRIAENLFAQTVEIEFRDCDKTLRPKISFWLNIVGGMAEADYASRGLSRSVLLARGVVFLLSKISYRILKSPRFGEKITVRTFECGMDTVYFLRGYECLNEQGEVCAAAISSWLLCNPETHRILRPAALGSPVMCSDIALPCLPAAALPTFETGEALGSYRVMYCDLDANGHFFSANYGDLFLNYLPADKRALPYADFTINYVKEAKIDETLKLTGREEDGGYMIIARHADETVCFIASIQYK